MVGMRLEPGMSSPNRIDLRLPNCREGCSLPATSVPKPAVAWPIATSQQEELHPTPGVGGTAIDILVPFTSGSCFPNDSHRSRTTRSASSAAPMVHLLGWDRPDRLTLTHSPRSIVLIQGVPIVRAQPFATVSQNTGSGASSWGPTPRSTFVDLQIGRA